MEVFGAELIVGGVGLGVDPSPIQLHEMICLNFTLDGATLVPEMRSPFDLLIEGLKISSSRGDKI